jgi:hypothetical protein
MMTSQEVRKAISFEQGTCLYHAVKLQLVYFSERNIKRRIVVVRANPVERSDLEST